MNRQIYFAAFILSSLTLVLTIRDSTGYVPELSNGLDKNHNSLGTEEGRIDQFQFLPAAMKYPEAPYDRKQHGVRVAHLGHYKPTTLLGTKNYSCSYHHPEETLGDTICLELTHADLDCSMNGCNQQYDNCALEIEYTLTSDSNGDHSVEASVTCNAEIIYLTKHGHILYSGSRSESEHHSLNAYSEDSFSISLVFPFSLYESVIRAELKTYECHINGEYHH